MHASADEPPLCVDLDGTLSITDTLLECLLIVIKRQPYLLFALPLWILGGRAKFKQRIYALARLSPASLGYREPFLTYLKSEAERGRRIILATAAPEIFARAIADYLDCFTDVIGTRDGHNLKGKNKAKALVDCFGERGFDYAGNDWPDIDVWAHARRAIVVAAPASLQAKVEREHEVDKMFDSARGGVRACLRAMRVHQWSKNVLVFVPLVAAHRVFDPMLLLYAVGTFFSFGLIASGGYIVNDLLDLASDRKHPRKRKRPFASGSVSIQTGLVLAVTLILAGLALTTAISLTLTGWLFVYLVLTLTYSSWLKSRTLIDVFVLAGLYTHRLIAGAIATGIAPSFWLLAFSTFVFLSLAMLKRYSELIELSSAETERAPGRGYGVEDLDTLLSLGTASGYSATLVLALYMNSMDVEKLYSLPQALWFVCPLFLYWMSRAWVGAKRGKIKDDPLVFALKDPISRLIILLILALMVVAAIVKIPCAPWAHNCA